MYEKHSVFTKVMENQYNLQGLRERLVVDTSEKQPVYLLVIGKPQKYIRLSAFAYELLYQNSLGKSFEEIAEAIQQKTGKNILPFEVEAAYQKVIAEIHEIEYNSKIKLSGFLLRFPLIPQVFVNKIASCFSVAYYQPVALFLLAFIVTATVVAPRNDRFFHFTGEDLIWGYFFFFISLLLHELGHASACVRYGSQPSDIGFTIYLIFPAFYSDVTDAWKLKRLQRLIVDLGGIFFQLVVGAVYVFIYNFTQWTALKIAILMIASSCLLYLNPIFKFV